MLRIVGEHTGNLESLAFTGGEAGAVLGDFGFEAFGEAFEKASEAGGEGGRTGFGDGVTVDEDLARVGFEEFQDEIGGSGFAGAGGDVRGGIFDGAFVAKAVAENEPASVAEHHGLA